jgi:hypothetical protein
MNLVLNPLHFPSLTQEIFDLRQVDDILWSGTIGNPYPSFYLSTQTDFVVHCLVVVS